ncbi:SGNH/GDSL hydrolase family protein [Micromonospora sp. NPDC000207]|uniref:SGNH/GDSL hydrolase family protein n=1 Tax=Micromonospora sp. NPDC000207 TaxID=3154246 RepID=UPI00332E4063
MLHRPLARALSTLAVLATAAVGAVLVPASAQAAEPVHYVALGDSYSSGVGAAPYEPSTCLRSQKSYAPLWAAANSVASFGFPACAGAVTSDVISTQVGSLSSRTTIVTITIGGNDAGFVDVITSCRFGSTASCTNAVNEAKTFATGTLPGRLDRTYAAIRDRAPNARLIVLGYPRLFETGSCGALAMSTQKRTLLNEAADTLAVVTADRARAAGATFADTRPQFAGHGVCGAEPWIRDVTGVIEAYHPNAAGYRDGYLPALTSVTG